MISVREARKIRRKARAHKRAEIEERLRPLINQMLAADLPKIDQAIRKAVGDGAYCVGYSLTLPDGLYPGEAIEAIARELRGFNVTDAYDDFCGNEVIIDWEPE
ncbi:MAG: hypothetical protein ABFD89_01025 [Bryobacteraceae bacterium]